MSKASPCPRSCSDPRCSRPERDDDHAARRSCREAKAHRGPHRCEDCYGLDLARDEAEPVRKKRGRPGLGDAKRVLVSVRISQAAADFLKELSPSMGDAIEEAVRRLLTT
jgi:uncharacterized protein (DUF4415 family)